MGCSSSKVATEQVAAPNHKEIIETKTQPAEQKQSITLNMPAVTPMKRQNKPLFPEGCKSLLCKYLTDEVWEQLQDAKDQYGYSFSEFINSGVVNSNACIGVYAGSADSYIVFAPLLDNIIEEYHGFKKSDKHITNWDISSYNFDPLDSKYCLTTRIRSSRNLAGFPLGTMISKEQRQEVEGIAKKAFAKFEGELAGDYYSLEGMDKEVQDQLEKGQFLFKQGDKYLAAAGLYRDWPNARGVFVNKAKTLLIWVNEEDHFRVVSMQKGGDIKATFTRLSLAHTVMNSQANFAINEHLGAIATCPTNIGTGIRASVQVKLRFLSQDMKLFENIAAENNVQIRSIYGGKVAPKDNILYDVSNKRRIGITEAQMIIDMYNSVKAMIEKEKELEKIYKS